MLLVIDFQKKTLLPIKQLYMKKTNMCELAIHCPRGKEGGGGGRGRLIIIFVFNNISLLLGFISKHFLNM